MSGQRVEFQGVLHVVLKVVAGLSSTAQTLWTMGRYCTWQAIPQPSCRSRSPGERLQAGTAVSDIKGAAAYPTAFMIPTLSAAQSNVDRRTRWHAWARALGWVLAVAYFLAAALVLGLKYWLLPNIGRYSAEIEHAVSQAIGERVSIARIGARWNGLHAELDLDEFRIYDRAGRTVLELPAVRAVIGWRSIPLGSLRLHSLALDGPDLQVRRDRAGRVFVAGLQIGGGEPSTPGAAAWLAAQPEIVVNDARIQWDDELRSAPRLALSGVDLVLQNRANRHRFSLRARTAPELASALDLRGELESGDSAAISSWKGRLFASLDYTDLAAWRRWIDYPIEIQSGRGAVRVWATLEGGRIMQATADLALAEVKTRLSEQLSWLDMEYVRGRLSAAQAPRDISFSAKSLALKLAGGAEFPAADIDVRWQAARDDAPAKGEIQASAVELGPLASLMEFLPIAEPLRERASAMAPRGKLKELKFSWTGELPDPSRYTMRGHFADLAVKKIGRWGGFSGASGILDADESGGSLRLESGAFGLELPGVLPEERVGFDSLVGSIGWKARREQWDIRFSNVAIANRDVAGTLQGSLSAGSGKSAGALDLTGSFSRIDARALYRYIPYLPSAVGDYLKASIGSGVLSDARLRIKGDPRHFPFADARSGIFEASARIANGEFEFSERWPNVKAISGELHFDRSRFQILASRATIMGARVVNLRAQIADLYNGDEALHLEGQAEGPVMEFLRFIDASPVAGYTRGATRRMSASGAGRLQLGLDIPIRRPAQTRVAGAFQFAGGGFTFDPGAPPLAQLNGRLEFTETGVSGRNLSAQFLGGPSGFSIATRPDEGISVNAQGSASMAAIRAFIDLPLLARASGSAAWTGTAIVGPERFDLLIESPLAGVDVALPAPLGKRAGETLALRIERTTRADAELLKRVRGAALPAGGDAISVVLGKAANALIVRRRSGEDYVLHRGALGINEPAPALPEAGVAAAASFAHLDIDRWQGLLGDSKGGGTLASVRLSANTLDAGGKRFHQVSLRASPSAEGWSAIASSRELEGSLAWQGEGRGRIVARLKHFTVPEPGPDAPPSEPSARELPSLDIVADEFVLRDKKMGRLEALAANQGRDWRIEKLSLASADATLVATGSWQNWASKPSISLNFKLDVSDAGNFLNRLGFPGTVRGGTATLEGKAGWVGGPQAIDYPTLTGEVRLAASKGQFLRAEPGIAKLLGILSLQSWITFDFREVFGEGFVFESIASTAKISRGILSTDDFTMAGKSALVSMSGTVDLARETQELKVRVVPSVGDSASTVAGLLLANPVTALGAMLAQRLLKDPLGRIFAAEYGVTGTWDDPKVDRSHPETSQAGNPNP